jgi:hypothetical protein
MRLHHWLLGVLLALSPGCSDDFAPYSSLDRLRILALQAEPPTPLPGETAALSALTFAPAGEVPAVHWTWCPVAAQASDDYACPLDEATAAQVFAASLAGPLPSLDLGDAATATLPNPFSAVGLATLCRSGLESQPLASAIDCADGYPITVVLDASTATASLRAGFVLRLPAGDPPELNRNPTVVGLALAGVPLGDALTPLALDPEQTVDLHVDVPADAAELRSIPASEGPPGQRLERLTTSWFATSGKIDKARTSFIDGVASLAEMSSNRYTAPSAEAWPADGMVEFAAVVRDDRGGQGWLTRRVQLGGSP